MPQRSALRASAIAGAAPKRFDAAFSNHDFGDWPFPGEKLACVCEPCVARDIVVADLCTERVIARFVRVVWRIPEREIVDYVGSNLRDPKLPLNNPENLVIRAWGFVTI